jgi:hypothetical protein
MTSSRDEDSTGTNMPAEGRSSKALGKQKAAEEETNLITERPAKRGTADEDDDATATDNEGPTPNKGPKKRKTQHK